MVGPTTGVLFYEDLRSFAPWIADRAPRWAGARALHEGLVEPTILPPPGLVLVVRTNDWPLPALSMAWLRLARRLVIVVEGERERTSDPELLELLESERREVLAALGNVRALWFAEGDLDAVIDRALEMVRGDGAWQTWTAEHACDAVPPGPWLPWVLPSWSTEHEPALADGLRHLASRSCLARGRPALLDPIAGERVDLATGARHRVEDLAGAGDVWSPLAPLPDGERWLARGPRQTLRFAGAHAGEPNASAHGVPIGVDPTGRIAWAGGRCMFHWYVVAPEGPACWTPSSHAWPDGHAKKLYGYADNDPLWVHLAPDASACLSVYERDALITPGMPFRWRDAGAFALGERARGEPRALLFQRTDTEHAFPADPASADEDARDRFATVTLGPSDEQRYVVGLDAPTWRVRGDRGELLGGPDASWVVFDAQHRARRRGEGRLLAGWDRWIVIERGASLHREDLTTGCAEDLGPSDRPITAAVAVPGSPNVVLLSSAGRAASIRVV